MNWRTGGDDPLARLLVGERAIADMSLALWDRLIPQAREASMLATVARRVEQAAAWDSVPEPARVHLEGAWRVADQNARGVAWELECLREALAALVEPPVLLKGAAYKAADLPNAQGRICHDIDLLFPRAVLKQVEALLFLAGWMTTHLSDYDQRYYREWMHELPPMQHLRRGSTLDVHHNILPETFVVRPDPERLLERALPLEEWPGYRVLCPAHMIMHSVVHLFSETEWDRGLRDLYDVHVLVEHFASQYQATFWEDTLQEARLLDLERFLYYGLVVCQRRFGTRIPADVLMVLRKAAPRWPMRDFMEWLFQRGLDTRVCAHYPASSALARPALFLRGHWIKMPPLLLMRHLFHKAFLEPDDDAGIGAPGNRPEQHG